jgi:hypothetical protein
MRLDVYHHFPELKVVHEVNVNIPQPFIVQLKMINEGQLHMEGGQFMYIVKDDNPDVGYTVVPGVVKDSEGNVIPDAKINVEVSSDNSDAVALTPTDPANPLVGVAHFGNPGVANINVVAKLDDGTILGSFGAQFTVTLGNPAAIAGGTISFEGLTEAP